MWSLECWDTRHLLQTLDEVVSYTSDLGADVKVTDFAINRADMRAVLPEWFCSRNTKVPLPEEFGDLEAGDASGHAYHNPFMQCQDSPELLRNAIGVPGSGHAVHNVVKTLPAAMASYHRFEKDLKIVEMVLCHPGRRERVVAKCVLGTIYVNLQDCILEFGGSLYADRWGCIAMFCKMIVQPMALLRRCWSQPAYEEHGAAALLERVWVKEEKGRFKPSEFTRVIKSGFFRNYHSMVIALHTVPRRLEAWFEGCPCHEQLLMEAETRHKRGRALLADGLPRNTCPVGSCRLVELVDGKLDDTLTDVGQEVKEGLQMIIERRQNDSLSDNMTDEAFHPHPGLWRTVLSCHLLKIEIVLVCCIADRLVLPFYLR